MSVSDGDVIDLGSRKLKIIASPGHASHHICIYDDKSGGLFTGDAAGIYLPSLDVLSLSTPPPDFDLELCVATIDKLRNLKPDILFYSHFGPTFNVEKMFQLAIDRLYSWKGLILGALNEKDDFEYAADKLAEEMNKELTVVPKWINDNMARMCVLGYLKYLRISPFS
jgi:glyoxylase-like metal-dependent hydrolase (beta-lactamase superfamily II)